MEPETQELTKNKKSLGFKISLCLPSLILLTYIFLPAAKTIAGIIAFEVSSEKELALAGDHTQANREIQKFFRKFDTTIDLDDIIYGSKIREDGDIPFELQGCLAAKQTVYVPVKFRVPYYGVRVLEWCLVMKN